VRVALLGDLRVDSPDGVLHEEDLRGRRAVVLFARLAAEPGHPVPGESLAEAVWGWSPPPTWPAALRNTIAIVRSALESIGLEGVLQYARGAYTLLLSPGSTVDLVEATSAASGAELAASSETWGEARLIANRALVALEGTFLPGPATPWVEEVRAGLVDVVARLRRVAGECALRAGDLREAETLGRLLVEEAPLREDGHRFLMRALQAGGNTGEALRAYEVCRKLLLEELGATPSELTTQLFVSMLGAGDPVPDPEIRPRSHVVAPLLLAYSGEGFVGRAEVLARIARERVRVGEAGPICLRIEGESGIGKTRLAAEVAAAAYDAGLAILHGRADDRVNVPFRPVIEAVGGYLATLSTDEQRLLLGAHAGVLARFLPSLKAAADPVAPTGVAEVDQRHLARAVEHVLGLASAGRGAVLVLDDLQFAQESTLRLVQEVTAESARLRVLVLLLHRPTTTSGTQAILEELTARTNTIDVELGPLDEVAVAELVRRTLGPSLAASPAALAAELWARTNGNPLLVTELLQTVDPSGPIELPERTTRVEELVRQRIVALRGSALPVLTLAAATGLEFDPEVVVAASAGAPEEARAALAAARQDGLVVPATSDPSWLAFRHSVVQEVLLASLNDQSRMVVHQRLGTVLEGGSGLTPAPPAALAYHFDEAAPLGEWTRAVRYLLRVARTADEEWMHDDALDAAERALKLLDDADEPDPGARLDALTIAGRALGILGRQERGATVLAEAFDGAVRLGDAGRAARAALAFEPGADSDIYAVPPDVLDRCQQALGLVSRGEAVLRARLLARVACGIGFTMDGDAGRQAAEEAVSLARTVDDPLTLLTVLRSHRRTLSGTGEVRAQRALEDELLPLARVLDDVDTELSTWACRFETCLEAGDGAALEAVLDAIEERSARARVGGATHMAAYSRAALALLRGDLDAAEALIDDAARVGRARGIDPSMTEAVRIVQLAGLRGEQDRLPELRPELTDVVEELGVPEWLGFVAVADAAAGDLDAAAAHLEPVFAGLDAGGFRPGVGVSLLAHIAEPLTAVGDVDRARFLYDLLAPHAGHGTFAGFFAGPIDWHLATLARCLGQDLAAQAHARAAEEFSQRIGAPLWTARCAAGRT
jgi:DNA-binding SARP family transcriptional activator